MEIFGYHTSTMNPKIVKIEINVIVQLKVLMATLRYIFIIGLETLTSKRIKNV